uniref:CCHC-type domain-containing protein n=1 Tax=Panagrolaimus sp. ES5 TaxID=591445 RepID=A0AC34F456_9BILA
MDEEDPFLARMKKDIESLDDIDDDILNDTENDGSNIKKTADVTIKQCLKTQMEFSQRMLMKLDAMGKKSEELVPVVDGDVVTKIAASEFRAKGLRVQFVFNASILNMLNKVKDADANVREAIEELSKRNKILQLGDGNPKIFQLVDAEEATKELSRYSESLSKDVRDLISTEGGERKRKRFHGAGSINAHGAAGSYAGSYQRRGQIPSLLDLNIPWSNSSLGSSNSNGYRRTQCYSCSGYGHISKDCPAKRNNARRSQYW